MPNNSSARREKDKKKKDKKKKGKERTDTPPLLKEDTPSVDSATLSLSVAGKEQARESSTLPPSVAGKEQVRQRSSLTTYERSLARPGSQDLLLFLHQMEGSILKHAEDEDDSWAASHFRAYFVHLHGRTIEDAQRVSGQMSGRQPTDLKGGAQGSREESNYCVRVGVAKRGSARRKGFSSLLCLIRKDKGRRTPGERTSTGRPPEGACSLAHNGGKRQRLRRSQKGKS